MERQQVQRKLDLLVTVETIQNKKIFVEVYDALAWIRGLLVWVKHAMHVRPTFKQSILFIQWALLLASNIGKVEYHSCPTGLLLVFLGAAKYKISYVPVHLQAFFFFLAIFHI